MSSVSRMFFSSSTTRTVGATGARESVVATTRFLSAPALGSSGASVSHAFEKAFRRDGERALRILVEDELKGGPGLLGFLHLQVRLSEQHECFGLETGVLVVREGVVAPRDGGVEVVPVQVEARDVELVAHEEPRDDLQHVSELGRVRRL